MRAKRWNLSLFVVLVFGVMTFFDLCAVQAKTINLSFSELFPAVHMHAKLIDSFAKDVEQRTNGQVKITHYPGGALLKGPQIYDGIVKGITDMGMSVLGYSRGRFPGMEAIDLPLGYPSGKVATAVINEFYKLYKPKGLSDTKVLFLHAHGPGLLFSKVPVHTLEDVKGLKIRSYGFSAKVAEALGGVPVAMAQDQAYEALQKGVVDATIAPYEVLKGWKQAEVIKYMVECYSVGYTAGFFVSMNLNKWNSLPPDVQKVFEELGPVYAKKYGEAWDEMDRQGKAFSIEKGNEVITLSPEESARWAEAVIPVIGVYEADALRKGLPGKTYVNSIRNLIKILSQ